MHDATLEYLGNLFVDNNILDKKGITFIVFIELWKQGRLEEVLN
ncbi:hypothetical protein ACIQ1D_19055 [Lysinibacillus xylanilyticus]